MKNFKYPLQIEGTNEQLQEIAKDLILLGYMAESSTALDAKTGKPAKLVTNSVGKVGVLCIYAVTDCDSWFGHRRTVASADNKELVLALAAVVDSPEWFKGEYYVYNRREGDFCLGGDVFTRGQLYKATKDGIGSEFLFIDNNGLPNGFSKKNDQYFRKATKEEILEYFKVVEAPNTCAIGPENSCTISQGDGSWGFKQTAMKKIIGYRLKKKEYAKAAGQIVFKSGEWMVPWDCQLSMPQNIDKLRIAGVLDLWFEPIYEKEKEEKRIIRVHASGDSFDVTIEGNTIITDDGSVVPIDELRAVVNYLDNVSHVNFWKVRVRKVDIGCKEGILVSSLKEVIKAYDIKLIMSKDVGY